MTKGTGKMDSILEHKQAMCLKTEAAKDNIWVDFKRGKGGLMVYRVIKTNYMTYEGALRAVQFYQSQLAPEVRP